MSGTPSSQHASHGPAFPGAPPSHLITPPPPASLKSKRSDRAIPWNALNLVRHISAAGAPLHSDHRPPEAISTASVPAFLAKIDARKGLNRNSSSLMPKSSASLHKGTGREMSQDRQSSASFVTPEKKGSPHPSHTGSVGSPVPILHRSTGNSAAVQDRAGSGTKYPSTGSHQLPSAVSASKRQFDPRSTDPSPASSTGSRRSSVPSGTSPHPGAKVLLWSSRRAGSNVFKQWTLFDAISDFFADVDNGARLPGSNEAEVRAEALRSVKNYSLPLVLMYLIANAKIPLEGPYCAQPSCKHKPTLSSFEIQQMRRKLMETAFRDNYRDFMPWVIDQLWGTQAVRDAAKAAAIHLTEHLEELFPEKYTGYEKE